MHTQVVFARKGNGAGVHKAGIAIKHQICHRLFGHDLCQMHGPILRGTAMGDIACAMKPKGPIAGVKPHPPGLCPGLAQHLCQAMKKRPMGALQKQKHPLRGRGACGGLCCECLRHILPKNLPLIAR